MYKLEEADSIDDLVNIDDLDAGKLDTNEPFNLSSIKALKLIDINNKNICPVCGKIVNFNNKGSVEDHRIYHSMIINAVENKGIYPTLTRVKEIEQLARKRMFDKSLSLYSREYAIYFYLLAKYSRHIINCIKFLIKTVESKKIYFDEYVISNPEQFPRDLIPYAIKKYSNDKSNYMIYRAYSHELED